MSGGTADTGGQVIAVDLGGTKMAVARVDRHGTCGPVTTRPTPARQGPDSVLATVAEAVQKVAGTGPPVVAVGVGAAGVIDTATGTVVSATDAITGWPGTQIADVLHERLGLPVVVDNDVNAHAAGEAWLGAGRGARNVLLVAVGTGVGGAVVLNGQPLRGAHHAAGEIGHVPVRGAMHLRCACGRAGHLEALASGPGLLRHYHSLGGDPTLTDTRGVVERARAADELSLQVVRDAAAALGTCLAGVVTLLDPDVVVVGGGLAEAGEVWWEPMELVLRSELIDILADVAIKPAELGTNAALVGAGHLAWSLLTHDREEAPL